MKWMKQGAAVVLAAALTLSLLATALMAASKNWLDAELGDLSQYYETGNSADPGYYSTVEGDQGGTSYGIYMFASNAGTPLSFVQWLQEFKSGSVYRYMGDKLYDAYAYNLSGKYAPGYGSNFNATWRSIGDDYPEEFTQAQKDYWETHAYADLLSNLKSAVPSFDLDNYSMALRNVLWSRSVHHGAGVIQGANSSDGRSGATGVVLRAFDKLGGFQNQSEAQIIQAIYAECSRLDGAPAKNRMSGDTADKYGVGGQSMAYFSGNSGDVQLSVYRRLHVNEPADALVMLYAPRRYRPGAGRRPVRPDQGLRRRGRPADLLRQRLLHPEHRQQAPDRCRRQGDAGLPHLRQRPDVAADGRWPLLSEKPQHRPPAGAGCQVRDHHQGQQSRHRAPAFRHRQHLEHGGHVLSQQRGLHHRAGGR